MEYKQVTDQMWTAMGDRTRRRILDHLRLQPCAVGELAQRLEIAQPQASKHLRVLREAHLVQVRTEAQRRIYAIDPDGLIGLDEWLAPYRQLWNDRLDALGRHLDATTTDTTTPKEHHS